MKTSHTSDQLIVIALELMHAIDKSPSPTLREILRKDYEKIINDNATG